VLIRRDATMAGTVRLNRLLVVDVDQKMAELATNQHIFVRPEVSSRDVFEMFDKYNLRSLTVVDQSNRPIGSITVDDVVSHMRAML